MISTAVSTLNPAVGIQSREKWLKSQVQVNKDLQPQSRGYYERFMNTIFFIQTYFTIISKASKL